MKPPNNLEEIDDLSTAPVQLKVNWPEYMEQHKLVWDIFPARWENGLFIGNGIVGAMIWADVDSSKVRWYLGRSDVGKLDFPGGGNVPMRIQVGSMDLHVEGKILVDESSAELDIWNGEARGSIKTTKGCIWWRSFTASNEPVIFIELLIMKGNEKGWRWVENFTSKGKRGNIEGINTFTVDDRQHHPRSDLSSGGHAIAWVEDVSPKSRRIYISLSSSPVTKSIWDHSPRGFLSSLEDACISIKRVRKAEIESLESTHRSWWHEFYQKSFVSFPGRELESYYWIQLYKMASSSREGYPMIDNHGIWSVEPPYGFATWDLNVQVIYRLHLKSNHLELGEPLLRFMDNSFNEQSMWNEEHGELRAGIRQQTFMRYHFFDTERWEHPDNQLADGPAKFLWGCHNYWLQYKYSMDASLLRSLLHKLEGGINAMAAVLEQEADGTFHIPSGRNWENWVGKDPTGLLAVLRWALETARNIGKKLDYDKDKLARWENLQMHLADYPTGEYPDGSTGFLLGSKFYTLVQGAFHLNEVPVPHRHWTHLLMIFPLQTLAWEQEDKRELIRNSVDYWSAISSGLNGEPPMAGYSPCASICFYAGMGQKEKIPGLIDIFLYGKSARGPNVWASTMYREHGPVIETPLFFAASLLELLLQSYGGIIKVFPAMPDDWSDAAFHEYRAEGGFLISAKYKSKKTEFIRIKSLAGEPCFLQTGMESVNCFNPADNDKIRNAGKELYEIKLKKGESILMFDGQSGTDFTIEPVKVQSGKKNAYGLNKTFLEKREFMHDLLTK